jgi:hypothetical protein
MHFSIKHDFCKILICIEHIGKEISENIDLDVLGYVKDNSGIDLHKILNSCVFNLFKENEIKISYDEEKSIRNKIKHFCETDLKLM